MSRSLRLLSISTLLLLPLILAAPAHASVHLMQVQRLLGGVDGDSSAQAIQLRMRAGLQNQTQSARLVVRNAAGLAPVVLATPASAVPNQGVGVKVLFATASFVSKTNPPTVPDFTMSAIPAGYLAAGSLTFESNLGDVFWRISWGGASYTGPGTGSTFNDVDGRFNPAFGGALPSASTTALQFTGGPSALSTNNAADYAISAPLVSVINNAGTVFTLQDSPTPAPVASDALVRLLPAVPNPFNPQTLIRFELSGAGETRIRVFGLNGALIRDLYDGFHPAGEGSVLWNGVDRDRRTVASGVYLIRVDGPGGTATQAVSLIK